MHDLSGRAGSPPTRAVRRTRVTRLAIRDACASSGESSMIEQRQCNFRRTGSPFLAAPVPKESGEKGRTLIAEHSLDQIDPMIEAPVLGDVVETPGRPCLEVGRTVDDPIEARPHGGAGTHGARLESHHQGVAGEPPIPGRPSGGRKNPHLGVGGGILQLFTAIVVGSNDVAVRVEQDGTYRHVALGGGAGRFRQGGSHGGFELGMIHGALHYAAIGGIA